MAVRARGWFTGALLAAATACSGAPAAAQSYSGIYIFGDSLVDSGNAQDAANFFDALPPPFPSVDDPAPASLGYFEGRFSNGYNFADLLSIELTGTAPSTTFPYGFPSPVGPIPFDVPNGTRLNFAYGGAQAIQGSEFVPDLTRQVSAYAGLPGPADPNALYVITIGGNDLRQLVPRTSPIAPEPLGDARLATVADVVLGQTARLFELGARNILLTSAPDIGLMPRYLGTPDEAARRAAGSDFSEQLDLYLLSEIDQLALNPDQRLTYLSFNSLTDSVFSNPSAFGFSNVTAPCLAVVRPSPGMNCDSFFFFDDVHPTASAHRLVASSILGTLSGSAVPEPDTWAMMLVGFGAVGAAMRRRRRNLVSKSASTASAT